MSRKMDSKLGNSHDLAEHGSGHAPRSPISSKGSAPMSIANSEDEMPVMTNKHALAKLAREAKKKEQNTGSPGKPEYCGTNSRTFC